MKKSIIILLLGFGFVKIYAQIQFTVEALASTYQNLSGDIHPTMLPAYSPTKSLLNEGFVNDIPLGFSFYYNGKSYSKVHLNTNGFVALGAPFLSSNIDPHYEVNELRNPVDFKGVVRPIIAPFWDDLSMTNVDDISYLTEGVTPNRVFIVQWSNMIWQNGSGATLDFQMRIHETTNIVSFIYNSQNGTIGNGASASIGITSQTNTIPDLDFGQSYFISIENSSPNTSWSDKIESDNINTKPTAGQEYKFIPVPCSPPLDIQLIGYNTNTAQLSWDSPSIGTSFQIALSNLDILPVASTTTTDTVQTFTNLTTNADYYFFIKQTCGTSWTKFKFRTGKLATFPFNENFENCLDLAVPSGFGVQSGNNDFADMHWQSSKLINAAGGSFKAINSSRFAKANSWLFTPSFSLIAGGVYNLNFKQSRTPATNIGFGTNPRLDLVVKLGTMAGEKFMFQTIISLDSLTNTSYVNRITTFIPPYSGNYVLGFGYKSSVSDAIILLDDINITIESIPLPLDLLEFDAALTEENFVALDWKTANEEGVSHFEIYRSQDGFDFQHIGNVKVKNTSQNTEIDYLHFDKKPFIGENYYKLKIVDLDGKFEYSPIRVVDLKETFITYLYPNPSGREVFLKLPNRDKTTINVYSIDGKLLSAKVLPISDHEVKIELAGGMSDQIYLVCIQTDAETRILKWMIHE